MSVKQLDQMRTLVLVAVALVVCRLIASRMLPVYDDAFITFRYSRNLAAGRGFVYHANERVLGITCPAFGLVISLIYLLKLPVPQTVVVMNAVLDAFTLLVTVQAAAQDQRRLFAVVFGGLFALSPILARLAVGGMEMNLYLLLSLLCIQLYRGGRTTTSALLAALCYFLRPEALLLFGLLCIVEWFCSRRVRSIQMAAAGLVALAAGLLIMLVLYGQILPQSVIAKAGGQTTLLDVGRSLLAPDPLTAILIPLAIAGAVITSGPASFGRLVSLWSAAYVAAYALARPHMWSWYGAPVYYSIVLLAAHGVIRLVERCPILVKVAAEDWLAPASGALAVLIWFFLWGTLGSSAVTAQIYAPLHRWCRENIKGDASILAADIGAIGYYSDARIYDLAGLVWPQRLALGTPASIAQTYSPDYIFLTATRDTVRMMSSPPLSDLYQFTARFSPAGESDAGLNEAAYPRSWVQDYLLFERRRSPAESRVSHTVPSHFAHPRRSAGATP